ncbi:hypothetical protein [Modestobacter sp. Leaf380]|nr:hypothetical protein [Modestobacter sp. Leaf380]
MEKVGDAELFDVADSGDGVIDRPAERRPDRRPGPAIGPDGRGRGDR